MSNDSHVLKRDGSAQLGGPRPQPPEHPTGPPAEAETGVKEFGGSYTDPSTVGHFDATAKLKGAAGTPSPRQLAERQRGGAPTKSTTPRDLPAAPLG